MVALAMLGLALLVYTPMAYLLLRAGYRRRMWAGVPVVGLLATNAGLGAALDGGSVLTTAALVGAFTVVAALGFRPLLGATSYTAPVTVGQLVLVGVVTHLLAAVLFPLSPPVLSETDAATLALTVVAGTTPDAVTVSAADLHVGVFAVGVVVFLVSAGNAHVHGRLGEGGERVLDA